MEDDYSFLLCQEEESFLDEKPAAIEENGFTRNLNNHSTPALNEHVGCDDKDVDEEYIEKLFRKETSFDFNRTRSLFLANSLKPARLEAIAWILRTREVFGFHCQTAYLSMTYFDRFLSRRSINIESSQKVRLLSVTCLTLAAKMEEVKLPSIVDFDYGLDREGIKKMELLLLETLEWRMLSVTPFSFLHFFISKMCKDSSSFSSVVSRTDQIILNIMQEINLMEHRPSAIAAAAAMLALEEERLSIEELESKMHPISYSGFLDIEQVFACYNIMQRQEMGINTAEVFCNDSNDSPVPSRNTLSRRRTRRRLTFNNNVLQNEKRPT
ncbi:cyclin-D5-2-like [Carica papaya]|uniref:cyclin-D5-2-like n=1 Tax=Carica papaya TaxID=3649 RepID=UPI000B8CEC6C|nr:cyclin-D5-2-like [Carica papaya]